MRLPVSVVIPHRNRKIVARAVESIRRQSAQPSEIIIVDDGSLPEHRKALPEIAPEAKIAWLDTPHGPSKARNVGVDMAQEEWIAFLDDDDEWLPNKLERQWNTLVEDRSLSGCASAMTIVADNMEPVDLISHSPAIITVEAALIGTVAMLQTALLRRPDIQSAGGFDETLMRFEDKEFWIRYAAAGFRAYYDREPLAILNRRRMRRLTANWRGNLAAQLQVIEKHAGLYREAFGRNAVRRERYNAVRRIGLECGAIVGRGIYLRGCLQGGKVKSILRLLTTGRMDDVPYTGISAECRGGECGKCCGFDSSGASVVSCVHDCHRGSI